MKKTKSSASYLATAAVYSCIIFVFELLLLLFTKNEIRKAPIILFFSLSIGAAVFFVCTLFPSGALNRIFSVFVLFIISLWFLTEALLFRSFGFFYPPETIFGMASDVVSGFGGNVIRAIVGGAVYIIAFFLPPILLAVFSRRFDFLPKHKVTPRVALLLFALVFGIFAKAYINGDKTKPVALSERYTFSYDFNECVPTFGLLTSTRLNAKYSLKEETALKNIKQDISVSISKEANYQLSDINLSDISDLTKNKYIKSLASYFSSVKPTEKNEYTGIFKGKNIVFICAEALSPYAVSKDLTPTLYRLKNEGLVFTDYYQPSFGESTSGGEYALLLSQVPKRDSGEKGMSMQLASEKNLEYSLPALFAKNGYNVRGFHNNSYTYYKRNTTHPKMKMSWYGSGGSVLQGTASELDISKYLSPGWPSSDYEMIKATAKVYTNDDEPFFTYYLTVSGHNNYSFSENAIARKNKTVTDDLPYSESVRAYLSAQYELEKALKELISELKEANILNDTVIVLSNDHYPYGLSASWQKNGTDPLSELYGSRPKNNIQREKGVFFIWSNEISSPITIDKPVSSFDVMPTVLNLFGIEYDSRLLVGRDALSKGDGLVFFSDMSWKTARAEFSTKNEKSDPFLSPDAEYAEKISNEVKNKIYYSKLLRKHSFFDEVAKLKK